MRPLICTIDASIVIALDHLNLLPQLTVLFSRVLLPRYEESLTSAARRRTVFEHCYGNTLSLNAVMITTS